MEHPRPVPETVFFVQLDDDVVAARIDGKGSHLNSPSLERLAMHFYSENASMRFVIDLKACPTMDSTFMGVLAGITLRQAKAGAGKTTVVNAGAQARRLIEILGLGHVLDMRAEFDATQLDDAQFKPEETPEMSKMDRTVHMIQSHERLVRLDSENEVKFRGVLDYLQDSLSRQEKSKKNE